MILTLLPISLLAEEKNPLYQNPSPYLAMHGQDPVHWQNWQKETLAQATQSNKIIMISSGYFSCHWCHVMQKENYHDPEIAKLLNQHFVSVKIDRELTPDLDRYLIDFAREASGHAGWPQHVFLTPDGYPFFALTYQPKSDFLQTLSKINALWQTSEQKIRKAAIASIKVPQAVKSQPFTLTYQSFVQNLEKQVTPQADTLSGGLKGSNKFPNAPLLIALLETPNLTEELHDWLILTLDQMQSEHLMDHVNGGFYRYTVDPEWQIPHFEKMLYTQALLAKAYYLAGHKFNRLDYIETANLALNYTQKHLYNAKVGLYLGSQSAIDQHYEEGGDYLFSRQQLKDKLSPQEFALIAQEWQLNQPSPYQIKNQSVWHPKPTSQYWQSIKSKLQTAPKQIPTDRKAILGWNGLMLSAYAAAQKTHPNADTLNKGQQLYQSLLKQFQSSQTPRALSFEGENMGRANLQDYAFVIQGFRDWLSIRPSKELKQTLEKLQLDAERKFLTVSGWLYSDSPLLPGQSGEWILEDDAIPSPTAYLDFGHASRLGRIQSLLEKYPAATASYAPTLKTIKN